MTRYKVELTPLTIVHIGTGAEFGPLEYTVVNVGGDNYQYWRFSPEKIISSLDGNNRKEFLKIIDSNKLKEVADFLSDNVEHKNISYSSDITDTFLELFSEKIDSPLNQLLVGAMSRDITSSNPMLPGSSIKGALRTAFINGIASKKDNIIYSQNNFENRVLGHSDGKEDPFRALRISDCKITGKKNQIVGTVSNFSRREFAGIQMIVEQIKGLIAGGDAKGEFDLSIDTDIQKIKDSYGSKGKIWNPIKEKIDLETLIKHCNSFYKTNLLNEYQRFYVDCSHSDLKMNAKSLVDYAEEIKDNNNECLIRIGKFSQVENVTVNNFREPKAKKGWGKTRNISDRQWPMGWVKLKFEEIK